MKNRILTLSVCLVLFVTIIAGCGIPEKHQGKVIGGAAGAGVGAVIAGVAGGSELVGALLGGLAGAFIGDYIQKQESTREATINKYGSSTQTLVKLEDVQVIPATARPGDRVDLQMRYAVLSHTSPTLVTEEWRFNHGNDFIGNTAIRTQRDDGTYLTTVPIILPADAKVGVYSLQARVSADGIEDMKTTNLQVR